MKVLKSVSGRSVDFGGEPQQGWLPPGSSSAQSTPRGRAVLDLRLLADSGDAVVLEWKSRNTDDTGDRWYPSEAEAIREATQLFGIGKNEWVSGG
jgi:hypothetical protein